MQGYILLDKKLLKLKQDERLSHETLLSFCATAELVATKKLTKYIEYYEHQNNRKNLGELSLELAVKLECIRTSYQIFKKEHGFYNFPENLTKEELLGDVNYWIKCLTEQRASRDLIQLYYNFSNLIKGFAVSKADHSQFVQYDKVKKNTEEECLNFAYNLMKEGKRTEKIMDEVEQNIMQTGTSKTNAKIHRIEGEKEDYK